MIRHDCMDTMTMPVAYSGTSNTTPNIWKTWITAGFVLLAADVARVIDTLKVWQQRETSRKTMAYMDDRLLRNMGISREDAARESEKPFWRS